jgi:hypothetical protein
MMLRVAKIASVLVAVLAFGQAESASSAAASATAQASRLDQVDPKQLEVVVGRAIVDPETGFVKIAGEVRNHTGGWVESVRIDIDYLDAQGESLRVDSIATAVAEDMGQKDALDFTYASRHFVPPGEVSPFFYLREAKKIGGRFATYRLAASARRLSASEAPRVVIEKFSTQRNDDGWHVARGFIKNVGSVGCRAPEVVVAVYRADGKLSRALKEEASQAEAEGGNFNRILAPGESVEFAFKIGEEEGESTPRFQAFADCGPSD